MTDNDARFWRSVERIEEEYTADCDSARFCRRMKAKGFDDDIIRDRLLALDGDRRARP